MSLQKGKQPVGHTQTGFQQRLSHPFASRTAPAPPPPAQRPDLPFSVQRAYTQQGNTSHHPLHHPSPSISSPSPQGPGPTCPPHEMNKQSHLPGQQTMSSGQSFMPTMYLSGAQTAQAQRPQTNTQSFCLPRAPSTPRPISNQRPGPGQHGHDPQALGLTNAGHQFPFAQNQVSVPMMPSPALMQQQQQPVYVHHVPYLQYTSKKPMFTMTGQQNHSYRLTQVFSQQRPGQPGNFYSPTTQGQSLLMATSNPVYQPLPPNQASALMYGGLVPRPPSLPQHHPPHAAKQRPNRVPIIDPNTGRDVSADIYGDGGTSNEPTPPRSGESSARETPPMNPTPPPRDADGTIAAQFAAQVAAAALKSELPGAETEPGPHVIPKEIGINNKQQQNINRSMLSDNSNLNIREKTPELSSGVDDINKAIGDFNPSVTKFEEKGYNKIDEIVTEPLVNDISLPAEVRHEMIDEVSVLDSTMPAPVAPCVPVNEVLMCTLQETINENENNELLDTVVEIEQTVDIPVCPALSESTVSVSPVIAESVTVSVNQDVRTRHTDIREEQHDLYQVEREIVEVEEPNPQPQPEPEAAKEVQDLQRHNGDASLDLVTHISIDVVDAKGPRQNQKPKRNAKRHEVNRKGAEKEASEVSAPVPAPEAAVVPCEPVVEVKLEAAVEDSIQNEDIKEMEEEDRKVAAKNEENAKVSAVGNSVEDGETSPVIEITPKKEELVLKYNYREDQWSPLNPEGKKQYDRDFLLSIQHEPLSLQKPTNLPQLDIVKDRPHKEKADLRGLTIKGSFGSELAQNYVKSMSRPGMPSKRLSQTKGRKVITIEGRSIQKEVKLHSVENAWKPSRVIPKEPTDDDESGTEDLYKKIRGILNKLTPQKFDTLVQQIQQLPITNQKKLQGVMELVFEKALDEPNFSVAYAQMCKVIGSMNVPVSGQDGGSVHFRKLLVTRCQKEFEKTRVDTINRQARLTEIENSETEEKKKELQLKLENDERAGRKRSLGNIRFIGELFKLNILTSKIMHECLGKLLTAGDEESLECLCRLLTTIGKDMETGYKCKEDGKDTDTGSKNGDMSEYFQQMQKFVDKRHTSSRVRFMMQDVIDLRMNDWKPRREDFNPKKISQVHQDAKEEALMNSYKMHQATTVPKKDERRKPQRFSQNDDGWNTVHRIPRNPVDVSKFGITHLNAETVQLGPGGRGSGSWGGQGSSIPKQSSQVAEKTSAPGSRFTPLAAGTEQYGYDRRAVSGSRPGLGIRDKGIGAKPAVALEREKAVEAVKVQFASEAGRPKSRQASRDNSVSREVPTSRPTFGQASLLSGPPDLMEDMVCEITEPFMDEFLHNCDYKEACTCVCERFHPTTMSLFVQTCINKGFEKSSRARCNVGLLFCELVKNHLLLPQQFVTGLNNILEIAEDLKIDIPKILTYVAEIIGPLIEKEVMPLSFMKDDIQPVLKQKQGELLSLVLHVVSKNLGNRKVAEMWQNLGLQWSDFLDPDQNVNEFIQVNELGFTLMKGPGGGPTDSPNMLVVKQKLESMLREEWPNNDIIDWIESTIGERKKEPQFIRALMTAVCENAIIFNQSCQLNRNALKQRDKLLRRYVDHNETLELQSLYALQALMHKLQNPQGILVEIFEVLYDNFVITEDALTAWKDSSDAAEQEGKGVAVKSAMQFFHWLQTAPDDSGNEA